MSVHVITNWPLSPTSNVISINKHKQNLSFYDLLLQSLRLSASYLDPTKAQLRQQSSLVHRLAAKRVWTNEEKAWDTNLEELEQPISQKPQSWSFCRSASRSLGTLEKTPRFREGYLFGCRSIMCQSDMSSFWRARSLNPWSGFSDNCWK